MFIDRRNRCHDDLPGRPASFAARAKSAIFDTPKIPNFQRSSGLPIFINVTDVARSQKSAVFRYVGTAPHLDKRAGGRLWVAGFCGCDR